MRSTTARGSNSKAVRKTSLRSAGISGMSCIEPAAQVNGDIGYTGMPGEGRGFVPFADKMLSRRRWDQRERRRRARTRGRESSLNDPLRTRCWMTLLREEIGCGNTDVAQYRYGKQRRVHRESEGSTEGQKRRYGPNARLDAFRVAKYLGARGGRHLRS